jgi:hypothetical protein
MSKATEWLAGRVIDVLEWLYDHDVKRRRTKPFGG